MMIRPYELRGSGVRGHRRKPKLRNKSSLGEMDACRTRSRGVSTPNESRIRSVSTVRFTRMGLWVGGDGLGAAMNRSRTV
ncbi:MAG: hypothetical protein FWD57_10620, partial [Polyangiaceae bacterium]|nr:hypothetical protein [Polyangiaceae bacterium]